MKKIFTLIAAALMAVNVFAGQESVGVPTNNADGWFDAGTKTIHFLEPNSYRPGWWLAWNTADNDNTGQDFSAYTRFVVELSDIPEGKTIACLFEYVGIDKTEYVTADADGKIVIELDEAGKSHVKQAYFQATVADEDVASFEPFDVTFVKAYFENDEAPSTTKDLDFTTFASYKGDNTFVFPAGGAGWYGKWYGTYDPTDYPYLIIEVASSTGDVQLVWQAGEGNEAGPVDHVVINKSDEPHIYCADLTGWSNISQFAFQNFNFSDPTIEDWDARQKTAMETTMVITAMYFSTEPIEDIDNAISLSTVKANSSAPIFNLAGQQVSKAVKGVYIQNGKKFVVK